MERGQAGGPDVAPRGRGHQRADREDQAEALEELKRRRWADADQSAAALAGALWAAPEAAPVAPDFFAYADAWAERLLANGQVYYYKRVRSALKKLRAHVGAPLPFDRFGPEVLRAHQDHMVHDLGNTVNTACVSFTILRTVFKNAVPLVVELDRAIRSAADDPA